jgi:GrpB-like predicted nucleotidyltransferase (UPF0157 family)
MVEVADETVRAADTEPDGPRYFTRELSLLQWCERTLDQARPGRHPLLERVKFLAFSDFNLDEFLSIHFADLLGKTEDGSRELTPDGHTQTEQLRRVREALAAFMTDQRRLFDEELAPELAAAGIHFRRYKDLTAAQRRRLHEYFISDVFPVCTPLAVDSAHPFPFISNMSINLGVLLWDGKDGTSFARIKVPNVLPRLMPIPNGRASDREVSFVWLEDVIANNLDAFFPGVEVREVCVFRVVRDADIELQALEAADDLREVLTTAGYVHRPITADVGKPDARSTVAEFDRTADDPLWHKRLHSSADPGRPTNVHLRVDGWPNQQFALLFTDWLRTNPGVREEYVSAKRRALDSPDYAEAIQVWFLDAYHRAWKWADTTGWRP